MSDKKTFLIVSIIPHTISDSDAFKDLKELKELVDAYEGKVIDFLIQRREIHDKGQYIGRGKVREITEFLKRKETDVVVLNGVVNPSHMFDMKTIWQKVNPHISVWDRIDLILHIFSRHARTAEAKLQIELAAMRHMGPRIYGMGYVLSRQGGNIGTRGIGETNTELMKRHWREQMKMVTDRLEKLAKERERQLERRSKNGLKTVSLIGYTNAGKTSLFNYLTGKKKLVENALFVTLDSNVGTMDARKGKQEDLLISDTIGFINNLPTRLIDAFKSTLMESMHANVLLQVIDVSDEDSEKKIAVVENILKELKIADKKRIYIFSKIDKSTDKKKTEILKEKYTEFNPQFVSVVTGEGIPTLRKTLTRMGNVSPLGTTIRYSY